MPQQKKSRNKENSLNLCHKIGYGNIKLQKTMPAISENDFENGCCCILCGDYFEDTGKPGVVFCHGERVVCHLCYDALNESDQQLCKKAIAPVIKPG